MEGLRDLERGDDLPFDRILWVEYVPRALFYEKMEPVAGTANRALGVFLGTSIVGTLPGGWLADRVGRRVVIRTGFVGAGFSWPCSWRPSDRNLAMWLLFPLAVFIFMPTSVLVVLGQEYLPHRVGVASGVTLGLAVSVGGMVALFWGASATAMDWKRSWRCSWQFSSWRRAMPSRCRRSATASLARPKWLSRPLRRSAPLRKIVAIPRRRWQRFRRNQSTATT